MDTCLTEGICLKGFNWYMFVAGVLLGLVVCIIWDMYRDVKVKDKDLEKDKDDGTTYTG